MIILCSSVLVSAQISQPRNESLNELVYYVGTNTAKYNNTIGSPYIKEAFSPAKINQLPQIHLVRFNIAENTIEVKKADGTVMSLDKTYQYRIVLQDSTRKIYETRTYLDEKKKVKTTFFEKLHQETAYTLYARERIKYIPGRPEKSSYEPAVPAKFIALEPIYYSTKPSVENVALQMLPKKKKPFLALFKSRAKAVDKYIKKERLRLDKKADIIRILNFLYPPE